MLTRASYALRALRSRRLRIFFAGHTVSLVGSMMQQVAMAWLVYRLTGSTVLLGLMAMMSQIPSVVMAPLAGAVADRWSRHRLVVLAQSLACAQAVVAAVLVLGGFVEVWHLVALAFALGIVAGIDVPARQSLLVQLVEDPDDLANAIALNSSMFNAARLVGPALGGLAIAWWGEGPVFVANALSYFAVLGALWRIRPRSEEKASVPRGSVVSSVLEGIGYARSNDPIRSTLILLAGVSLVAVPYVVLLPVFATEVLGGDARTLGLVTSSSGLGALVGAFYLASRDTVVGLGRVIVRCTAVFGTGMVLLGLSSSLWVSCTVLVAIGFGILTTTASINTILQTLVSEEKRGRLMSLYTVAFVGASAVGSFGGGWLASHLGAQGTVAIGGVGSMLMGGWFALRLPALRAQVHPVYVELGILPELARGVNRASELRPRA